MRAFCVKLNKSVFVCAFAEGWRHVGRGEWRRESPRRAVPGLCQGGFNFFKARRRSQGHTKLPSLFSPTLGASFGTKLCNSLLTVSAFINLQLYELDSDPKRKEFLDELFVFMQKRGELPWPLWKWLPLPHQPIKPYMSTALKSCSNQVLQRSLSGKMHPSSDCKHWL